MRNKEKALYIKKLDTTFIQNDLDLLEEIFDVTVIDYKGAGGFKFLWMLFISCFTIPYYLLTHKKVFIWFADYHAFLPVLFARLMGRKSYVFIGGYDAAYFPEINYGVFVKKSSAFAASYAVKNANFVLPVAHTLIEKLKKRVGKVKGEMIFAPFGFDKSSWFADSPKERIVLTVSIFRDHKRMKIKGLDFFALLAEKMPEEKFVLVGEVEDSRKLLPVVPKNLKIYPPANREEIRSWLSRSKVYAQLSLSEGQPNAVCEAMLCECVPVVTDAGDMPVLVEDIIEFLPDQNIEKAILLIKKALDSPEDLGVKARKKMLTKYKLGERKALIEKII